MGFNKKKDPDLNSEIPEGQEGDQETAAPEEDLETRYAETLIELEEQKKEVLRILAESENFKKRLVREKEEFQKFAAAKVIEEFLPIVDNLELAAHHGAGIEACKDLMQGIEMTLKMFKDTLNGNGLEIIEEEGCPFDPNLHEAMGQLENDDMDEGCVCQMLQKGYRLHGRLIRPAKVLVSKACSK